MKREEAKDTLRRMLYCNYPNWERKYTSWLIGHEQMKEIKALKIAIKELSK